MSTAKPAVKRRKKRLSRAIIAETAMKIVDEKLMDEVSLSEVANRLSVTPMALYRYISDKRDLEQMIATSMLSRVFSPTEVNEFTDWKDLLVNSLKNFQQMLISYPTMLKVITDYRFFLSPEHLDFDEQLHEVLYRCGVPPEEARTVMRFIGNYVIGTVTQALAVGPKGLDHIDDMYLQIMENSEGYERLRCAVLASIGKKATNFETCCDLLISLLSAKYGDESGQSGNCCP